MLTGWPSSRWSRCLKSKPINSSATLAAVWITPPFTTPGKPQPTGPSQPERETTSAQAATTSSGLAASGVGTRTLSAANSPVSAFTGAPLIPVPPMSNPNTSMRPLPDRDPT
jgi:hypothetical protein